MNDHAFNFCTSWLAASAARHSARMRAASTNREIRREQAKIPTCASAHVEARNANALLALGITLPASAALAWRPTRKARGDIPGVCYALTVLCTDGCVAWFQRPDGSLLFGHTQCFTGKVETLFRLPKAKAQVEAKPSRAACLQALANSI